MVRDNLAVCQANKGKVPLVAHLVGNFLVMHRLDFKDKDLRVVSLEDLEVQIKDHKEVNKVRVAQEVCQDFKAIFSRVSKDPHQKIRNA